MDKNWLSFNARRRNFINTYWREQELSRRRRNMAWVREKAKLITTAEYQAKPENCYCTTLSSITNLKLPGRLRGTVHLD